MEKEINGDTDRPTNQPGEYSARVRKRENILNGKIFVAKTFRIKRINCVNFQILQIEIIWTLFRLSRYHPGQEWTGKLFFSRGRAGQGQKSMGRDREPPLPTVRVKSVFANLKHKYGPNQGCTGQPFFASGQGRGKKFRAGAGSKILRARQGNS